MTHDDFADAKSHLIKKMNDMNIKTQDDAVNMAALVYDVVRNQVGPPNANLAVEATKLCKNASDVALAHLKENKDDAKKSAALTLNATRLFLSCSEVDTQANYPVLEKIPFFNITTPFPILPVEVAVEHYPEYLDEEVIENTKKKISDAANNFVDICTTSLKSIAITVSENDNLTSSSSKYCSAAVLRRKGTMLTDEIVQVRGFSVSNFTDLVKSTNLYDIRICTWMKDPFWWNDEKRESSTSVILLKVLEYKSKKEITQFRHPLNCTFDITDPQQIKNITIRIPKNQTFEVDEDIIIVRITARMSERFHVKFSGLETNVSLKVLLTEAYKPTIVEIRNEGRIVNEKEDMLSKEHESNYNTWYYVSIIPDKIIHINPNFACNISAFSSSCYFWNNTRENWDKGCKGEPSRDMKTMSCSCNHLSILMGQVENNVFDLEEVVDGNIQLQMRSFILIFACLAVAFAIYCFLILLVIFYRNIYCKNLFMFPDFVRTARYLYLLKIRTGKYPSAGTTASICIKIFGSKSESRSHVINYPDPEMYILQWGGEDFFVFTTDHLLGDIEHITLWSDLMGRNPGWYCKDVIIYDLQCHKEYHCVVNEWLDIPPHGQILVKKNLQVKSDEPALGRCARIKNKLNSLKMKKVNDETTYFLKVTILLSIFLTVFTLSLFLYGLPKLKFSDEITKYKKYGFHMDIVIFTLLSATISFIYHSIIVFVFRNSEPQFGDTNVTKMFPYKLTLIAWILLTSTIVSFIMILIIFGFWLPKLTSWLWLLTVTSALLIYFLIFDNIYQRILNMKMKSEEKVDFVWKYAKRSMKAIERHRRRLLMTFGSYTLRPYLGHLYNEELNEHEIKQRQKEQQYRLRILNLLEDIVMFSVYITLLYVTVYAQREPLTVHNKEEVLQMLHGKLTHTLDYEKILSRKSVEKYVNQTIINSMQTLQWYSRFVVKDPGNTIDFANKYLGVVRLRQKRVKMEHCNVHKSLRKYIIKDFCAPEFDDAQTNTSYFERSENKSSRMTKFFEYSSASDAGFSVVMGKFGTYFGGGFVTLLGRNMFNSFVNLDYIVRHSWIDRATRVIFVEFLLYNVNTNLFTSCRIMVEISATDFVRTLSEIESSKLLFINNEDQLLQEVTTVAFIVVVIVFTLKLFVRLCRLRKKILGFWFFVDLSIIILCYVSFALFVERTEVVETCMQTVQKSKRNEFINYFKLFQTDHVFNFLVAFQIFVSTIRLWKLLRFNATFQQLEKTIAFSAKYILVIICGQGILVVAFAASSMLLFGTDFIPFRSIPDSYMTLIMLPLGVKENYDLEYLTKQHPVWGKIFHTTYMFVSFNIMCIYVTIIVISYHDAKIFYSGNTEAIKRFIVDEVTFYKTFWGFRVKRLSAGVGFKNNNPYKYVTEKSEDFRFANSVTLSFDKLETMACITKYHLKKTYSHISDDQKAILMATIIVNLRRGVEREEKDMSFRTKVTGNKLILVNDKQMRKMEQVAERLLQRQKPKIFSKKMVSYQKELANQTAQMKYFEETLESSCRIINNINLNQQ